MQTVVTINVRFPEKLWRKFENKCYYYEITHAEVLNLCVEKFLEGEFDKELQLPVD